MENQTEAVLMFLLKPIALNTPKISSIAKETFTPIPKKFMLSVTG